MILTFILVLISLLIICIHFSAKHLAEVKKNYYWIFVVINFLIFISGIIGIYYLSRYVWHDEKGIGAILGVLVFMFLQMVLVLLISLIANPLIKWWRRREAGV
ncbi:hypothetical protein [Emticicia sp. C21]|uniref:hypothetical protein n=1 Tax=Emticicia sp. C21 TaxID=2302915 RepID=UPI000E804DD8|nr:hypothetical protein [Emticicia sp. C21]RFS16211.1 hypothetical protein D0T08_10995 [Emticicia sp. C21]